jgi:hypothetical protein
VHCHGSLRISCVPHRCADCMAAGTSSSLSSARTMPRRLRPSASTTIRLPTRDSPIRRVNLGLTSGRYSLTASSSAMLLKATVVNGQLAHKAMRDSLQHVGAFHTSALWSLPGGFLACKRLIPSCTSTHVATPQHRVRSFLKLKSKRHIWSGKRASTELRDTLTKGQDEAHRPFACLHTVQGLDL